MTLESELDDESSNNESEITVYENPNLAVQTSSIRAEDIYNVSVPSDASSITTENIYLSNRQSQILSSTQSNMTESSTRSSNNSSRNITSYPIIDMSVFENSFHPVDLEVSRTSRFSYGNRSISNMIKFIRNVGEILLSGFQRCVTFFRELVGK